jgi:hypothetical protein
MYFSAGFFESHPVYDQTQGSGAVFFLLYGLMLQSTKAKWGGVSVVVVGVWVIDGSSNLPR